MMGSSDAGNTPLIEEIAALVEAQIAHAGLATGEALRLALRLQAVMLGPSAQPAPTPAVPVEDSIQPDHLICLETGAKVVLLRRHLMQKLGQTPEQYRRKWDLPPDYPLVAPDYARARALSRSGRRAPPPAR
ncbi:MucR family transcriptional regulator [Defluviimonas sp. 20V17]|uniref:MucR family transcriptional regulator n=1 Tax=Allgaiera indica TaxID=765699 RepID=A0AAN4UP45_9RHOB|nr:MucR family transcriptional regulator [Allgaiera indica]KDB03907.1 MucR family transcriptional regulator [Defluviimonas sp. 20V17]GHD99220.1 MucR family transcriptional regulator [Allgaiera indica]SDW31120.1 transcriptional regulator, MucR family [Allgaiera indica]